MHVVLAEVSEGLFKQWVGKSVGYGALHKLLHTVAHEHAHLVYRALRHAVMAQRVVAACGKIGQCAEQRAVEVEDVSLVFVHGDESYLDSALRRAMYLPSMSNSMFTTEPTFMSQKLVLSWV